MTDNVVLPIQQAPPSPVAAPMTVPGAYVATARDTLGGRPVEVPAAFDFDVLRIACTNPNVLPNPGHSAGCSPLLRELLQQTGLEHKLLREVFDDGNEAGHLGGNAIDITAVDPAAVARLFRQVPQLFETFAYQSEYPSESLYILAGSLTSMAALPGLVDTSGVTLHLSSSLPRLLAALHAGAPAALVAAATGQFTSRDVYAVEPPANLTSPAPSGVQFW